MATRFYLAVSGTPGCSPAINAGWEQVVAGFASRPTSTTKASTARANFNALHGSTATSDTCWYQWVSDTLDVDQSISGTVSMVVRVLEGIVAEDAHLAFSVRAVSNDGGTVRGTLLDFFATSTEFAVTAETRIHSALAISTVAALSGDRIVIELGVRGVTPSNTQPITFRFGDNAVSDFALTAGLTTDLNPWVELSQTLTFGTPVSRNVTVGQASEADTGQTVTPTGSVTVAAGQASEADSALAITPHSTATVAVGQATEADTAQPVTPVPGSITKPVGQASEADTALAVTPTPGAVTKAVGQASEADTAQVVVPTPGAATTAVGQATEADTALGVTPHSVATIVVGQASEQDSAQSVTPVPGAATRAVGQASEADTAQTIAPTPGAVTKAVGQASETDTALTVTPAPGTLAVAVGQATETDSAQVITPLADGVVVLGQAVEADEALAITAAAGAVTLVLGQAIEVDEALVIHAARIPGRIVEGTVRLSHPVLGTVTLQPG